MNTMKTLWFCKLDLTSLISNVYNGGGWMRALRDSLLTSNYIKLGVVTIGNENYHKVIDGIDYFQVSYKKSLTQKIKDQFKGLNEIGYYIDSKYVQKYLQIVQTFKPDIIHIWGTESNFGLIIPHVSIPCIIHLQGILNPYKDYILPPSYGKSYLSKKNLLSWNYQTKREKDIFASCRYFIGRTDWDKSITKLLSPHSKYFYCSEMLRSEFINAAKWRYKQNIKLRLLSVISSPLYKGPNLILKTALLLKTYTNLDFEWNVFGVSQTYKVEEHEGINGKEVNVYWRGVADINKLIYELQTSNIYIHPSYIDNSPNSVCEAMYIGMPVIATNVGGESSIIENGKDGILVPSHDSYMLAYWIKTLADNPDLCKKISENAIVTSENRHNPDTIKKTLTYIYNEIKV